MREREQVRARRRMGFRTGKASALEKAGRQR